MLKVEIISPEGSKIKIDATSVTLPGTKGSFQILEHHAAIVSTLEKGFIKIKPVEYFAEEALPEDFVLLDGVLALEIKSGTAEFSDNNLVVLVE